MEYAPLNFNFQAASALAAQNGIALRQTSLDAFELARTGKWRLSVVPRLRSILPLSDIAPITGLVLQDFDLLDVVERAVSWELQEQELKA